MMKLSRNLQWMLLLALGIGAFSVYKQMLYMPMQERIDDLVTEKQQIDLDMPETLDGQKEIDRLKEVYASRHEAFTNVEAEIEQLEENLPAKNDMSTLLENLTMALDDKKTKFVAIEPTFKDAEEGKIFDAIEIDMQFQADFKSTIEYFKELEKQSMLLGVRKVEIEMDSEEGEKPLVSVSSRTLVSEKFKKETIKKVAAEVEKVEEEPKEESKSKDPFKLGNRPYDQTLPGNHALTMVVWNGGTPVALIDGKVMKEGALLDNRKLVKIEPDGVWFLDDDIHYYLQLES